MILSQELGYCFFAIPRTGSQALSKHLINHYQGSVVKPMHVSYSEFHQNTLGQYSLFLNFTIIRNPLDSIVSSYFKMRTDHNGRFSRGYFGNGKPINQDTLRTFRLIHENNWTFSEFFLHSHQEEYWLPRHVDTKRKVDMILRYESLQEDFHMFCEHIDRPYRPIPILNKTQSRQGTWPDYYDLSARKLAKKSISAMMEEFGYSYPEDW